MFKTKSIQEHWEDAVEDGFSEDAAMREAIDRYAAQGDAICDYYEDQKLMESSLDKPSEV